MPARRLDELFKINGTQKLYKNVGSIYSSWKRNTKFNKFPCIFQWVQIQFHFSEQWQIEIVKLFSIFFRMICVFVCDYFSRLMNKIEWFISYLIFFLYVSYGRRLSFIYLFNFWFFFCRSMWLLFICTYVHLTLTVIIMLLSHNYLL